MRGLRHIGGAESGFTLIEVLVTAVIIAVGLLGLAGLQAKMAATQMEAYQRAHALVLVEDMAARINSQRSDAKAGAYAASGTMTVVGLGDDFDPAQGCAQADLTERDLCEWSRALKGAGTTDDSEAFLGAMIGARGCIERLPVDPATFRVSVAWQGLSDTVAPSLTCGQGADYGSAGRRRVLAVQLTLADLNRGP
ncbi:MAG: type IV pilus modification protein PilV [Thiocapsa sp.]|uniref:type IV pilus modification protein PilV n=1 Tax=Thiocapsa sp. TaxID=2024551 RepID=UPI001BCAF882|nr:type IV pilus modification protein PilV [Thiocapsa sp.]QVL49333.1 MAG: type IV pilus modification protein PilV [Thiocapsa sp.]